MADEQNVARILHGEHVGTIVANDEGEPS
jgi:hypothetical protein